MFILKAAWTASAIMASVPSIFFTKTGLAPHTNKSWRSTRASGVAATIGALGLYLDTMRVVEPEVVGVIMATALAPGHRMGSMSNGTSNGGLVSNESLRKF